MSSIKVKQEDTTALGRRVSNSKDICSSFKTITTGAFVDRWHFHAVASPKADSRVTAQFLPPFKDRDWG